MSQMFPNRNWLYFMVILCALTSCNVFHHFHNEEEEESKEKLRNDPAEHFFLARAYPAKSLDINVYHQALQTAQRQDVEATPARGSVPTWTVEGPGNIGARVNTITVHPTDTSIVYIGFSTGGAWKTTNGGANWSPIFDAMSYLSIGCITLDPQNPNTIYIGTGDPNVTGYPFVGNGLYKSTDAGATWKNIGLVESRIISKVIVHPTQPNTIWVATMGNPFARDDKRGLFKTTDGGTTWTKVLYIGPETGITDVEISPSNPNVLYAASWDRIRNNQESIVSGIHAKVYKTINGGTNWTTVSDNGLPDGELSRIGLAISGTNGDVVYALYQTTGVNLEGIYKTSDAGASWDFVPTSAEMKANLTGGMGWYFGKIEVNPLNDSDLCVQGVHSYRSKDGGSNWENFSEMMNDMHVDHHAFIYKGNRLYIGTDGGAYTSSNNGNSWRNLENIPTSQLYHVDLNPNFPDRIYAGAQDNGTIVGNAASANNWKRIYGGDGFRTQFILGDTMSFYAETQRGDIWRTNDGGQNFDSAYFGISGNDRRSWDTPYMISRINKTVMYTGTHRFYKGTTTVNANWKPMSTDLTKGDLYGGSFNVISTIDESPKNANILYAGTSDGNVWRSMNAGVNWEKLSGLPDRYVTCIKAHPDSSNVVYVSFSGYKYNENLSYLYRSNDNGTTWKPMSYNLPGLAINNINIVSDRELYVATDGGVYHSEGFPIPTWARSGDMPYVPVYDLAYNAPNKRLLAATHGRSIMSIATDDLHKLDRPLTIYLKSANGKTLTNTTVSVEWGAYKSSQIINNQDSINFILYNINVNDSLKIKIERNDKVDNGVSTTDLVALQKHILNVARFDIPYKYFAADVNQSNTITTFDIVSIRKVLLKIDPAFAKSPSWRFIDANIPFPIIDNALNYTIPNTYIYAKPFQTNPSLKYKFIGIKTGDANNSAN